MTKKFKVVLVAAVVAFAAFLVFPAPGVCLNVEMTALLTQAWANFDMKWVNQKRDGKEYLQEVWFGIKESFIKEKVTKFREHQEGDLTLKEFFLDKGYADGSNLVLMIGGIAKYKPNRFLQASMDFISRTRVVFDPAKMKARFIIESKLEKLVSKRFNFNLVGLANRIVKSLSVKDEIKEVDITQIINKMNACELKFNRFVVQDGYYYISGSSVTDVLFTEKIEKSLQALKAGNVPEAARLYRESLKK